MWDRRITLLSHAGQLTQFTLLRPPDIFWLKDEPLEASDNLPDPDVIAQEIVDDLEFALEQFRLIANDLGAADKEHRA